MKIRLVGSESHAHGQIDEHDISSRFLAFCERA